MKEYVNPRLELIQVGDIITESGGPSCPINTCNGKNNTNNPLT